MAKIMKTYRIEFEGRESGALGVRYLMTAKVDAPNEAAAIAALYEDYECIRVTRIKREAYVEEEQA